MIIVIVSLVRDIGTSERCEVVLHFAFASTLIIISIDYELDETE